MYYLKKPNIKTARLKLNAQSHYVYLFSLGYGSHTYWLLPIFQPKSQLAWNFISVLPLKLCIQKSLTYKLPDFSLMLNHTTRFFWFSSGYGSQTDRPTISNQKVATFLRGRRRLRRQRLCTSVLTPPTPLWTLWELKFYEVTTLFPLTDGAHQLSDSRAELVVLGSSQSRAEIWKFLLRDS